MCNPPPELKKIATIAGAVINPTVLLGSEAAWGAGKGAKEGYDKGGVPGAVSGAFGGATKQVSDTVDTVTGRTPPSPPAAPAVDSGGSGGGGDAGPPPTPTPANPTDLAAMIARKRLATLRMGLLSTMSNGGQGLTTSPLLNTPSAYAVGSGTKTLLGQ